VSLARKLLIGKGVPEPSFLGYHNDAVDRTVYTFASVSICRNIVVVVSHGDGAIASTSSLTVDGEAISLVVADTEAGGFTRLEMWSGVVTTGNATGNIVVTFANGENYCNIAVIDLGDVDSTTAEATDVEETDNTAMTAANSAYGAGVGAAMVNSSSATCIWTGDLTDQGDAGASEGALSVAIGTKVAAGTLTATANMSTSTQFNSILATFR